MITLFLTACGSYNDKTSQEPSIRGAIVDNTSWYLDQSSVVRDITVTFTTPNSSLCAPYTNPSAALRPCTLDDVNHDTNPYDTYKPALSVAYTTTTFPLVNETTNALLLQKGKSTRSANQKSYKVNLNSKTNLYEGQRKLQYNKQFFDMTRIRNKLSFDLMQSIPNIPSLKTEFVRMTLNGIDLGLFTKVESYDKEYLLHRGWNKDDNLYKAQNFTFYLKPELALNSKGKASNLAAFSTIIEPQRGKYQSKLIEMLEAVNKNDVNIDAVVAKYFNRENYLTWLAINILMGNVDTITQNFFLLNPLNSDTFYFLPWDYDDGWGWYMQHGENPNYYSRWEKSIARWWDSPLHSKFLSIKKNRDALDLKIQELRTNYLSDAKIQAKVDSYKGVVAPYILTSPDLDNLVYADTNSTITKRDWEAECDILKTRLQDNLDEYESQKGSPMPFWLIVEYTANKLTIKWDKAVDFENDEIVYDVLVSNSPDFNTTERNETALPTDNIALSLSSFGEVTYSTTISLASGKHYVKIKAREKNNAAHFRYGFDSYYDSTIKKIYHGVFEFVVN